MSNPPGPSASSGPSGSSGITITAPAPGGGVVVASDTLLSQIDALAKLSHTLQQIAGVLGFVIQHGEPLIRPEFEVPPAAIDARRIANHALHSLLAAADRANSISASVLRSLAEYEQTEAEAMAAGHRLGEDVAYLAGVAFRLFGIPLAVLAAGGLFAGAAIAGRSPSQYVDELQEFLRRHPRILNNPKTVAIIRELAADSDGFGAGAALEPLLLARIGEQSGKTGVSSSANSVVGLGRKLGLFEPTGVTVAKTSTFEYGSPPTSLEQRAESFPNGNEDPAGAQIRVDRYVEPGKPDRFDVFIGGTVTFDPRTGTEPFDLQSDLAGVGQQPTASVQAVAEAMNKAGVTPNSPVVLNGYSQGGLVATLVAASGKYDVRGVVTFGAPSAQVHVPASVPVLTIRNSEDLVPATSGYDVNSHAVVVTRDAFANQPIPPDLVVAGHDLSVYQQTAAAVDGLHSSEVRGILDPLNQFGAGATKVDSTLWTATRTTTQLPARCR